MNLKKVSKYKLLILTVCLLTPIWIFSVELPTVIDTVFTENSLQAGLFYFVEAHTYSGGVLPFYQDMLCVGDVYLWDYPTSNVCSRHYLSFSIEQIPDEYTIENVMLKLYQYYCCGDGNDSVYPLFYGNQLSCMIDHVDYGLTFEYSDFTPTIYNTIGAISSELTYGWKQLDITNAYLQDMNQSRPYCQVMIYFPILTDYDFQDDCIYFKSSYANNSLRPPQIVITYRPVNHSSDEAINAIPLVSVYPNPCCDKVTIAAKDCSKLLKAELFNLKGQRIDSKYTNEKGNREINITFNKDVSPGIYLLKYSSISAGKPHSGTIKLLINK